MAGSDSPRLPLHCPHPCFCQRSFSSDRVVLDPVDRLSPESGFLNNASNGMRPIASAPPVYRIIILKFAGGTREARWRPTTPRLGVPQRTPVRRRVPPAGSAALAGGQMLRGGLTRGIWIPTDSRHVIEVASRWLVCSGLRSRGDRVGPIAAIHAPLSRGLDSV
jgi:hypothetical protein